RGCPRPHGARRPGRPARRRHRAGQAAAAAGPPAHAGVAAEGQCALCRRQRHVDHRGPAQVVLERRRRGRKPRRQSRQLKGSPVMMRLVLFLLGVLALAAGLAWLADRPGTLLVTWQDYEIETSVFRAVVIFTALVGIALVAWSILRQVW